MIYLRLWLGLRGWLNSSSVFGIRHCLCPDDGHRPGNRRRGSAINIDSSGSATGRECDQVDLALCTKSLHFQRARVTLIFTVHHFMADAPWLASELQVHSRGSSGGRKLA